MVGDLPSTLSQSLGNAFNNGYRHWPSLICRRILALPLSWDTDWLEKDNTPAIGYSAVSSS